MNAWFYQIDEMTLCCAQIEFEENDKKIAIYFIYYSVQVWPVLITETRHTTSQLPRALMEQECIKSINQINSNHMTSINHPAKNV